MNDLSHIWTEASFVGGAPCLDFINTVSYWHEGIPVGDKLADYRTLVEWAQAAGLLDAGAAQALCEFAGERPTDAAAMLAQAKRLRAALHGVVTAFSSGASPDDADMDVLNAWIAATAAVRRLAKTRNGYGWRWPEPPNLARPLWPVVQSTMELLFTADPARLRRCTGKNCGWVFLDTSKGGRRRWCDMQACGNRAKAARHYRRRKAAGAGR